EHRREGDRARQTDRPEHRIPGRQAVERRAQRRPRGRDAAPADGAGAARCAADDRAGREPHGRDGAAARRPSLEGAGELHLPARDRRPGELRQGDAARERADSRGDQEGRDQLDHHPRL
ncbi:MAG: hypothetical protein AVDCRST_MAG40-178, partial [uncultured Gemmatimonadaceae bacterium]